MVEGLPSDVEIERTETLRLALPRVTVVGSASQAVGLRVAAVGGVEAVFEGDSLRVSSQAVGDGQIAITARAVGVRDTTVTVAVRVVPETCPPPGPAGARDYFPSADGDMWTLDAAEYEAGVWISRPALDATLHVSGCLRGVRSGEILYDVAGGGRSASQAMPMRAPYRESATNEVLVGTPAVYGLGTSATFARYAAGGPEVLAVPILCPGGPSMDFADGVGFVRDSYLCAGPVMQVVGRRLTRRP